MSLFDPVDGRQKLRDCIGEEAESLTYKFCVIDREDLERRVVTSGQIPKAGFEFKHIRTGEIVHVSTKEAGVMLVHTIADYQEQFFNWQELLEKGHVGALWPGDVSPQLRMGWLS